MSLLGGLVSGLLPGGFASKIGKVAGKGIKKTTGVDLNKVGGGLKDFALGTPGKLENYPIGTEDQRKFQNSALALALDQLGSPQNISPLEQGIDESLFSNLAGLGFNQNQGQPNYLQNLPGVQNSPGWGDIFGSGLVGGLTGGFGGALAGVVPGLFSKFTNWLNGPSDTDQANPSNLGQQNYSFDQALNALTGGNPYQFNFEPIRQNALNQFNQQTVPDIASRFSSLGTGGSGQRSSGFAQTLGSAGAGLQGNLAALEQKYGLQGEQLRQNQQQNAMNLLNQATNSNQNQQRINLGNVQNAQQQNQFNQQLGMQGRQFAQNNNFQQQNQNLQQRQFQQNALQQAMARLGQQQAGQQNQFNNLSQIGLSPQVGNQYFTGQPGLLQSVAPAAAKAGLMYATGGLL